MLWKIKERKKEKENPSQPPGVFPLGLVAFGQGQIPSPRPAPPPPRVANSLARPNSPGPRFPHHALGPKRFPMDSPRLSPPSPSFPVTDNPGPRVSASIPFFFETSSSQTRWKPAMQSRFPRNLPLQRGIEPYKAPRDAPRRDFASKSRKRALGALDVASWNLAEPALVLHHGEPSLHALGSWQAPRWARGEFLSRLVLSVSFLAQAFAISKKSGELRGAPMAAAASGHVYGGRPAGIVLGGSRTVGSKIGGW